MNQIKIHPLVIYLAICNLIIAKNFQKSPNFHKYYVGQMIIFAVEEIGCGLSRQMSA